MLTQLNFILRTLRRNRIYSGINILGLAVGVAAVLLIFRIVWYELRFNRNFKHYDRIARVITHESGAEDDGFSACVPIPAMSAMKQSVPQFEAFTRLREVWHSTAVPDPAGGVPLKKFNTEPPKVSFFAEPDFFKIFDLPWLAGNPETALRDAGAVVLTRGMAEKCFDNWQKAMGQTLVIDSRVSVVVRGVVADPPENCDFPLDLVLSYATLEANPGLYFFDPESWGSCSSNNQVYVLLKDKSQWDAATAALKNIGKKEYAENNRHSRVTKSHVLQPLSDLHYNPEVPSSAFRSVTKSRLWILSFIGLLVLLMACFNFINLATAQATQRAREVGVRKTLGSSRGQLIRQFLGETAAVTVLAVGIGAGLASVCLPLLQYISDVPAHAPFLSMPQTLLFLLLLAGAVTVLAGLYPALILARFDPAHALRNHFAGPGSGRARVRQGLVILQFASAVALIIGTLVTLRQLQYIRDKDLGFEKDLIYTFYYNSDSTSLTKLDALKQHLLQIPQVEKVSFSSDHPASDNTWNTNFAFPASGEDAPFNLSLKFADTDYPQTYGLQLVAGRWVAPSDTMREAVVNETLLQKLGITDAQSVLGQEIRIGGRRRLSVVGVAKDFHSHSVHRPHEALLISTRKQFYAIAGVKIRPSDIAATTAAIHHAFDDVYPEQVISGHFFDENIAQFYQDENRFANTCKGFSLLAIFIACLGLFGLSSHAAARRAKEIGIRKVLGASVAGITGLLARDFLKLVLIAFALASPLAYYLMDQWLQDFAFRTNIGWWVFAVAGLAAVAVAFLAVSVQSVRAALANPVESLKSE